MVPNIAAYMERDRATGLFVAIVPGIPGAHTQAETIEELRANLREVLALCLSEMDPEEKENLPEFVGVEHVEVAS